MARNFAIDRATGDYLLFLDAGHVLTPDCVATGMQVLDAHPEVAGVAPQCRLASRSSRDPVEVFNPLPYDPSLVLFRNLLGDAGAMFRASVFREHGLRFDPLVEGYAEWALWMDCARAGLRIEPIPRCLLKTQVPEPSRGDRDSLNNPLPLLGLLIDRHLPELEADEARALLTSLVHGWGIGAQLSSMSRGKLFAGGGDTFAALNKMATQAQRWPRLAGLLQRCAGRVLGLHTRAAKRR